jgi:GNAT superfamily N-acetyltransferase
MKPSDTWSDPLQSARAPNSGAFRSPRCDESPIVLRRGEFFAVLRWASRHLTVLCWALRWRGSSLERLFAGLRWTPIRVLGLAARVHGRGIGRALSMHCINLAREKGHQYPGSSQTGTKRRGVEICPDPVVGVQTQRGPHSDPVVWVSRHRGPRSFRTRSCGCPDTRFVWVSRHTICGAAADADRAEAG